MGKTQKKRKSSTPIAGKKSRRETWRFWNKNEGGLGMDTILAFFYKDTNFSKNPRRNTA